MHDGACTPHIDPEPPIAPDQAGTRNPLTTPCSTHPTCLQTGIPDAHADPDVRKRLDQHLQRWLGVWPPTRAGQLVVTAERLRPGWDGRVRPIQGVTGPEGTVLAISPDLRELFSGVDVAALVEDLFEDDAHRRLSARLGVTVNFGMPIFRWSERATEVDEIGEWVDAGDPRLPDWLRPFNGGILATFDGDEYMAGVGLKRHNEFAREISVGTDPEYRGQGLASQLVAQAAARIIAAGEVPIYQHGDSNVASAKVAEAAGFPDRGWHMIEIHPGANSPIRG